MTAFWELEGNVENTSFRWVFSLFECSEMSGVFYQCNTWHTCKLLHFLSILEVMWPKTIRHVFCYDKKNGFYQSECTQGHIYRYTKMCNKGLIKGFHSIIHSFKNLNIGMTIMLVLIPHVITMVGKQRRLHGLNSLTLFTPWEFITLHYKQLFHGGAKFFQCGNAAVL